MNIPKAIEKAFADLVKGQAIGAETVIRCWHNLLYDPKFTANIAKGYDRCFPCIDIRTSPPKVDDNTYTVSASTQILIATKCDADKNHKTISAIEEAVQTALDALYSQWHDRAGTLWIDFKASVQKDCSGVEVQGLTLSDTIQPYAEEELNIVGITVIVHYSRTDF